jgi:hypothetical protein
VQLTSWRRGWPPWLPQNVSWASLFEAQLLEAWAAVVPITVVPIQASPTFDVQLTSWRRGWPPWLAQDVSCASLFEAMLLEACAAAAAYRRYETALISISPI